MSNSRLFAVLIFVLIGVMSRFLPHPPNFTAINTIALFGATNLSSLPLSLVTVFTAIFLSDFVIGFYPDMVFVYVSFGLVVLLGQWLQIRRTIARTMVAIGASSLLFFVITNFGMWLTSSLYPKTCAGLGLCYVAATPFFFNQFLGDFIYTAVMFGTFSFVERFFSLAKIHCPKAG